MCPRPISLIYPGIQDFMGGYDYITVCAPLWLSHCGEKGVGRKGCCTKRVFEKGGPESVRDSGGRMTLD